MRHNFYTAVDIEDYDSQLGQAVIDGGLAICKTCGGMEGSLTTDCPGARISHELDQQVYKGEKDFIEGEGWVKQTSKSSPAYWTAERLGELRK